VRALLIVLLGLAAPIALGTGDASALGPCTITWVGDVDGDWKTNAAGNTNWSTDALPAAGDTVCLPAASVVTVVGGATVKELSVAATASLTVRDSLTVTSEAVSAGTIVLDGPGSDPTLKVADGNDATAETFTNSGTLRTQGRDGGSFIVVGDVVNTGQITAHHGAFYLNRFGQENRAYTSSSSGTITIDDDATLVAANALTVTGGTVATAGAFRVEAGGTLRVTGASTFSGANAPTVMGNGLLEFQTAGATTGKLATAGGARLAGTVPAGVTLTVQDTLTAPADAANAGTIVLDGPGSDPQLRVTDGSDATAETFTNSGTLRTQGRDGGSFTVVGDVVNSGEIKVHHGTLYLNRFGQENRAYASTSSGTLTIDDDAAVVAANALSVTGGTVTTAGAFRVEAGGTLRASGAATFSGPHAPTVTGNGLLAFQDAAGTAGALATAGGARLEGTVPAGVTLTVQDTLTAPAGAGNAGTIVLDGPGSDPQLKAADGNDATSETFTNTGTIRTQGRDGGSFTLVGDVVSSGEIKVHHGTLYFNRFGQENRAYTSSSSGTLTVDDDAALVAANALTVEGGTVKTEGAFRVEAGGTLRVSGAATFSGAHAPTVTGNALLAFEGATGAAGALAASGGARLAGTVPAGVTLTVQDTLTAPAGAGNAGTIVLDGPGSDPQLKAADGNDATSETFTNTGTIRTQGRDGGSFFLTGDIVSSGSITVHHGRLYLNRFGQENRALTATSSGTITIDPDGALETGGAFATGGALAIADGAPVVGVGGITLTGGTTSVGTGASLTTNTAALIDVQGGSLSTAGGTTVGPLRNAAEVTFGGAAGVLTVPGDFTQTAAGRLTVRVGGPDASDHDLLTATGSMTLDGTLAVKATNGFVPMQNQRFAALHANNVRTGAFAEVVSERTDQFEYRAEHSVRDVTLRAQDAVPPDTTITGGPDDGGYIADTTPTFTFVSNEAESTFQCSVDGADFDDCSGPAASHTTAALADGLHTFAVWAVDRGRNPDRTFAFRTFTVGALPTEPVPGGAPNDLSGPSAPLDLTAPGLKVSGVKLGGRRLRLRLACSEACSALVTVRAGRRRVLGQAAATLAANKKSRLRLKLRKRVRKARRVVVTVGAFDGAGNGAPTFRRTLKLKTRRHRP
jgi:hypothetical protein